MIRVPIFEVEGAPFSIFLLNIRISCATRTVKEKHQFGSGHSSVTGVPGPVVLEIPLFR
jgi:hypothetical protein